MFGFSTEGNVTPGKNQAISHRRHPWVKPALTSSHAVRMNDPVSRPHLMDEPGAILVPAASAGVHPVRKPAVPDYELLQPIGGGAYGEVWLARSKATGAVRAAKI